MPDINDGTPLKFDNAGQIVIWDAATGLVDYSVLRIEPGSLRFAPGLFDHLHVLDKGASTGLVMTLDEKPSTLSFGVRLTESGLSGSPDLIDLLVPTAVAGLRPLFRVDIEIPSAPHSATGQQVRFEGCWVQDGWEYQARSGNAVDLVTVNLMSTDTEPLIAAY